MIDHVIIGVPAPKPNSYFSDAGRYRAHCSVIHKQHLVHRLAIAKRDLPNNTEAIALEAFMDRRQGHWEKAIQKFKDALERDPGNSVSVENLALTLGATRQFRTAEQMFDRLIALRPDRAILKAQKPLVVYEETGDDEGYFAYADARVPVGCYSILLARLQGEETGANGSFAETREQLCHRSKLNQPAVIEMTQPP